MLSKVFGYDEVLIMRNVTVFHKASVLVAAGELKLQN